MDSIVLTTANAKTSEPHRLRLELTSNLEIGKSSNINVTFKHLLYLEEF